MKSRTAVRGGAPEHVLVLPPPLWPSASRSRGLGQPKRALHLSTMGKKVARPDPTP